MRLDLCGRSALFVGLLVLGACSSSSSNGAGTDAGADVRVDSYVAPFPDAGSVAVDAGVPSCTDGVKDQNETDIDCGGSCPSCPDGEMCATNKDCQSNICTAGICQELPPPAQCATTTDCTASPTLCVTISCTAGECADQPASAGTTCSDNGGNSCDGAGNCILTCTAASDCPASTTKCKVDTCTSSVCGTDDAALGTACVDNGGKLCDASGVCVACNAESDCAAQASECMIGACSGNKCDATPATLGATCSDNGGTKCDATGHCVACNTISDCPTPAACEVATCVANTCGTQQAATGAACSTGGTVCSALGLCVACNVASDCPTTGATCVLNACVP